MKKLLAIAMMAVSVLCQAQVQDVPFNGVVSDMFGKPIKGARVYVVDKNYYAKSDREGRFGLTNIQPTDTLHVVYDKQQYDIPVLGRKSIRIRLGDKVLQDAQEDNQLVDLGYGFVKRREQTSPSNGISGEVLRRTGQSNVLEALRGLVPGLNISSTGLGSASASLRGIGTINGSGVPLYFVDGVEVSNLDYLSIYDVESVEIMKDGSIYGSRGANGAILVHTKRGK